MKHYAVHVCHFTAGLDGLTRRKQRNVPEVLKVLQAAGRFSIFEATANYDIAKTMEYCVQEGLIKIKPGVYPWTAVSLTDKGLERLRRELI